MERLGVTVVQINRQRICDDAIIDCRGEQPLLCLARKVGPCLQRRVP